MNIPKYIGVRDHKQRLALPADAVTQGFGIIGKRGKGKSNLLACILEELARRGQSFVVLDPPDAHWGIRFAADAEGLPVGPSGFDVLLVGGDHGDVPLDPNGGAELAQVVVAGNVSCVISLRGMTYTAQQRFAADFGEEIFRINRTPRFIAFEEAHNFLPQKMQFEEQKRVLHAMDRIITEGRSSGLGYAVASQRPARINKDALEEVDNLFALGMPGPNDLDQVENWFKRHVRGDKAKLNSILDEIASLPPGECWLLSPDWLGDLVKLRARLRVTYHAGRTPRPGERKVSLARFTVTEAVKQLKEKFAAKQQERAQEVANLKEAKAKIRSLETELRKKGGKVEVKNVAVSDPKAVERAVRQSQQEMQGAYRKATAQLEQRLQGMVKALEVTSAFLASQGKAMVERSGPLLTLVKGGAVKIAKVDPLAMIPKPKVGIPTPKPIVVDWNAAAKVVRPSNGDAPKLRDGAERMLAALAQWSPGGMTLGQMRAHAGLKKSGTFSAYMSDLRKGGYIRENGSLVFATDAGLDYCKHIPPAPASTEEVLQVWTPKLRDGAVRMLNVLVEAGGEPIGKEELGERAGLKKPGTFSAYLSDLKTARLVVVHRDGTVAADKETLFLN